MTTFGWRLGDAGGWEERRTRSDRRSGRDRRAPVAPPAPPEAQPRLVRPTQRQLEVLALVASGKTFVEIASALGIAEQTVKNHSTDARMRLKALNLPQAVAICTVRGWLVPNRQHRRRG